MNSSSRAWQLEFKKLWSRSLDDPINCLLVGKPFLEENSEENDILVGTTAGRVLILDRTEPVQVLLETKGGSVQALCLYDLTGQGGLDMVVGDSDGVISMFSRQQLLSKHSLGCPVTQVEVHKDMVQGFKVTAGCMDGSVSSLLTHEVFWKLDVACESEKSATLGMRGSRSPFIRCMLSTVLVDIYEQPISTLIVCDGWPFLHLIQSDRISMTIQVPSTIQSMAAGYFLSRSRASCFRDERPTSRIRTLEPGMPDQKYDHQQVVLAGQNGTVYILIDYEVHSFFTVGFSLSKIIRFRPRDLPDNEPDLVVCVGHSNKVVVYQDGELLTEFTTSDWPHAITVGDLKTDGEALVLGLMDQTIEVYDYTICHKDTIMET